MMNETAQYYTRFDLELFEGTLTSHVYPWHWHDSYTIVLVEKGAMKYVYRDGEVVAGSGEVLVVNPFTSHYNFPVEECAYKVVFLPVVYVSESSRVIGQFQREGVNNGVLFKASFLLFDELKEVQSKEGCAGIAKELARLLMHHLAFHEKPVSIDRRIVPAIEFVQHHFDKKLTIDRIAATCHLSRFHFQRLFKESTGLTVHEYIQQLRTEYGKELLRRGIQITDTSIEAGYFDQSHFHKAFKRMWVSNPSRFL